MWLLDFGNAFYLLCLEMQYSYVPASFSNLLFLFWDITGSHQSPFLFPSVYLVCFGYTVIPNFEPLMQLLSTYMLLWWLTFTLLEVVPPSLLPFHCWPLLHRSFPSFPRECPILKIFIKCLLFLSVSFLHFEIQDLSLIASSNMIFTNQISETNRTYWCWLAVLCCMLERMIFEELKLI